VAFSPQSKIGRLLAIAIYLLFVSFSGIAFSAAKTHGQEKRNWDEPAVPMTPMILE